VNVVANPSRIAVVSAFRTYTGSTMAARAYFRAFEALGVDPTWYQCVSSGRSEEWDLWGRTVTGTTLFRPDLNLVLNSLFVFPRKLGRISEPLAFLTDPILLGAAPRLSRPVLLVHDMREFDAQRRSWAAREVYRRLFRHVDSVAHIVCVSDATRLRLVEIAHPRVPIEVAHHPPTVRGDPVTHLARSLARIHEGMPLRVLYLAADRPYKNILFFGQLAKLIGQGGPADRFQFTLVSRLLDPTRRALSDLRPPLFRVVPEVRDLKELYEQTDVLVQPSREEGYGLPPVEAMQFGIPVLGSDIPAIRETLGGSGTLLSPDTVEPWAEHLRQLRDPEEYRRLSEASAVRGQAFSTEAFALRVRDLYASWIV
jgi:glycosyltransferase involved in cell wall biosynthesis